MATAGWSGLFDGVHGDGHSFVNGRPRAEYIQDLMQRRGLFGYARVYSSTNNVPTTKKAVEYDLADAVNTITVPGTATDGRNPPNRDVTIENAHGDRRADANGLYDQSLPADVSTADADYAVDTRKRFGYAADKSGNGAVPLTGDPA